ncbi:hypothetical protein AB0B12_34050 [Streptomyces sp. NPDC044780]|uniref:hypothetical protein n=1 Tax=unclassified Streptomyces TaxID=2593676 RepID=UPI0034081196
MRGLTRASPGATAMLAGGAVVGLAAVGGWMLAGCGTAGQGVRKEGPARTEWASAAANSGAYAGGPASGLPSTARQKAEAVRLVKADPNVSDDLKASLKPCGADDEGEQRAKGYPVDVTYGRLTGATTSDLVINVMSCADGFGIGSYVYREVDGRYESVFRDEQPPVYAAASGDELRVTKLSYASEDAVCCPSSEDVLTYRWTAARKVFTVLSRKHTDYSKNVPKDDPTPAPPAGADDGTEG